MAGFVELHGDYHSLAWLDIKGNSIADLEQISYLAGCTKLRDLIFCGDKKMTRMNGASQGKGFQKIAVFRLLPQLVSLDGLDITGKEVRQGNAMASFGVNEDVIEYEALAKQKHVQPSSFRRSESVSPRRITSRHADVSFQASNSDINAVQPLIYLAEKLASIELQMHEMRKQEDGRTSAVDPLAPVSDRLQALETKITDLFSQQSSVSKNSTSKAAAPSAAVETAKPNDLAVGQEQVRLERIEKQMTQLLKMLSNPGFSEGDSLSASQVDEETAKQYRRHHLIFRKQVAETSNQLDSTLTIPTKIPLNADAKNASLVWMEGKPEKEQIDSKDTPNSTVPIRKKPHPSPSKIPVKPKNADSALLVNSKLIAALEQEERRLRENEHLYAEKIRSLTEELALQKDASKKLEQLNAQMKQLKLMHEKRDAETLELQQKFKQAELVQVQLKAENSMLRSKYSETEALVDQKKKELNQSVELNQKLQSDLEQCSDELKLYLLQKNDAQKSCDALEAKLKQFEAEQHRLNTKFIKDREQSKIKMAEARKENEMYKDNATQLQSEISRLHSLLTSRDDDFQKQLETVLKYVFLYIRKN